MELIELMSPHVAVPVIGVLLCAFMVFAFGFRSPVQPPSFDFEERKKRRTKQTKLKGHVSGDTVTAEVTSEVGQKSTPKPVKEIKPALSPKAKSKELKMEAKKEVKQDLKGEKKLKTKKEGIREEVATENLKKGKSVLSKKEAEEDGEWTTIQVTKKGKKQKPTNKREGGRAESAVESENEPEITPVSEAAAASPANVSEIDEPGSPEVRRNKTKKNKAEDKTKPVVVPSSIIAPVSAVNVTSQAEDQVDGKKKKTKREKKMSGEAAASAHENLPQDAAPASGQVVKKQSISAVTSVLEQVVKKQPVPAVPPTSEEVIRKQPDPVVAPASRQVVKKDPSPALKPPSEQDPVSIEQAKPNLKKKKTPGKENVKTTEKVTDIQIRPSDKPAEAVKKSENKLKDTISKATSLETSQSHATPESEPQQTSQVSGGQSPAGISFDEVGDLWQEATPKSKKKKSRRDN